METTLTGVVLSKKPTEKKKTKFGLKDFSEFELKAADGVKKCVYWGSINVDIVNQTITFNAAYDEKYNQYTVKGKLFTDDTKGQSNPPAQKPEEQKAPEPTGTSAPVVSNPSGSTSNREDFRRDAEESVFKNLESAQAVAEKMGSKTTRLDVLIPLADIIGRTMTAITLDNKKKGY